MKLKNYIFLSLLLVLIALNVYLFPKFNFYINNSTYLSIVIGALGTVLAFNLLKGTKPEKDKSVIAFFLPIVVFFGFTLFNVFYPVEVESDILKANGVETIAEITNKEHLQFKRAETYEFTIKFKNQKNEIIEAKMSTHLSEYDDHQIGEIINIKYSSENNQLVRLID